MRHLASFIPRSTCPLYNPPSLSSRLHPPLDLHMVCNQAHHLHQTTAIHFPYLRSLTPLSSTIIPLNANLFWPFTLPLSLASRTSPLPIIVDNASTPSCHPMSTQPHSPSPLILSSPFFPHGPSLLSLRLALHPFAFSTQLISSDCLQSSLVSSAHGSYSPSLPPAPLLPYSSTSVPLAPFLHRIPLPPLYLLSF
ncbi:hypothetical protein AMTR_s00005p00269480 [Amborella trichopoda]|uniref:Uncharacterized protein n=1 Tax=Amborella trichopoda TaxID=13333 RepID=W1PIP7_AMBTC|nr:hypothetical protein AMTR_s00005p00269480 [Amborella trichopoda]